MTVKHSDNHKMPAIETKQTSTDATTRDKLPEASPKEPGSTHFRALAGQRSQRTLNTQGLASRPPKLEKQQLKPAKKTLSKEHSITHPRPFTVLRKTYFPTLKYSHRSLGRKGGGLRTRMLAGSCLLNPCRYSSATLTPALRLLNNNTNITYQPPYTLPPKGI